MPDSDIQLWPLEQLLAAADAGTIRIPEFQRSFDLKDGWVVPLLASVSLGYPIGALTLLEAGAADLRFESRPVPGAPTPSSALEWLIVDGQQRLTALYQAFAPASTVLNTWCMDWKNALAPGSDRDSCIRRENASPERSESSFPLRLAFRGPAELQRWRDDFVSVDDGDSQTRFDSDVLRPLIEYRIPIIRLSKNTSRWTVRVHGGPDGPTLSDRYRQAEG